MFEPYHHPLLARASFIYRMIRSLLWGIIVICISLSIGMWGYHYFEGMNWIDAYVNAAMILSGMGPLFNPVTTAGKLFAGTYALFSGIIFLLVVGIMFGPLVHRFLHKFHLEEEKKSKPPSNLEKVTGPPSALK